MTKARIAIAVLVVILFVSVGCNVYQLYSSQAGDPNTAIRHDMVSQLMHTQNNANSEFAKLDAALSDSCNQLSTAGLVGPQARAVLSALVANNSLIVNAATCDANDVLVAVEPQIYSDIEGEDIKAQEQNVRMHQTIRPAMSNMIPLVEGFPGVVMVAPIFDSTEKLVGSLSIVMQPSSLILQSIATDNGATKFSMWAIQKNGTLIYDPDPAQQGKNLLTDPIYTAIPEVQAFTEKVATQQTGFGRYQYYETNIDSDTQELVNKEAYWTTVGIYGTEWRLVVWHTVNP